MSDPRQVIPIAKVHFGEPPGGEYSYSIPADLSDLSPGCRVHVPFGTRKRVGFVTDVCLNEPMEGLKSIESMIDLAPLIPQDVLQLARWISDYYLCDLGEAIAAAFPAGLKSIGKVKFSLSVAGKAEPWISTEEGSTADLWRALSSNPLTLQQIKSRFPDGGTMLEKFKRRGWIESIDAGSSSIKVPQDTVYTLSEGVALDSILGLIPPNAAKQRAALELFRSQSVWKSKELSAVLRNVQPTLRNFVQRGWVTRRQVDSTRQSSHQEGIDETAESIPVLSERQRNIVADLTSSIIRGRYESFLLYGVTGSGKSLIYLETVAAALQSEKSAIVMVPEISLTPQLAGRMRRKFGDLVGIFHSGLSRTERQALWQHTRNGRIRVVVGPRSAIFAPVENLGLIIVDEEHDDSYKQDSPAPRYHSKAAAFYRASTSQAVLLLGSATPDIITFHNARQDRIKLFTLPDRHQSQAKPEVRVVKWGTNARGSLFSPQLHDRITQRLASNEQIIILVNRRGFATIVLCPDCGASSKCPNCDISLRYHRAGVRLECHYCGYRQRVVEKCSECGGVKLQYNGVGTQRVERELSLMFPEAKIARLDLDITRKAGGAIEILRSFAEGKFDILLGTQMVAKGHDFPRVTLVGVLGADLEMEHSDYRSVEKSFRLLVQASGRAGRSTIQGEVVLQCLNPTHPAFRWIQSADFESMYQSEIAARQPLNYPPFGRLVSVTLKSPDQHLVSLAATKFRQELISSVNEKSVLGPVAPEIERLEGLYRRKLIIKLPSHNGTATRSAKRAIREVSDSIAKEFGSDKIIVTIDVDPVET